MKYFKALTIAMLAFTITCGGQKEASKAITSAAVLSMNVDSIGIERISEIVTFEGESLFEHINGGAEIFHLYDFIEVATADYSRGETEFLVDIFHFADADNAFGLYSTLRPENPNSIQLGVEGLVTVTSLDFVKGRFVVRLTGYEQSPETSSAIFDMAKVIAALIPGTIEQPAMFSLFPPDNRIIATERIHAESFLGQRFLNDVYSQEYQLDCDTVTLFLTDDQSGSKFDQWSKQAAADTTITEDLKHLSYSEGRVILINHSYYGNIIAGWKESKLLGIVGYNKNQGEFLVAWLNSLP